MHILPLRSFIMATKEIMDNKLNPLYDLPLSHATRVNLEILERATKEYKKPSFDIHETSVLGKRYFCSEELVIKLPFCNLVRFAKVDFDYDKNKQKKLLIASPMASHHASLLRDAIKTFLPHFDVYITDWVSANMVSVGCGDFDLDDYIEYLLKFMEHLGSGASIMGVCQAVVPALVATSVIYQKKYDFVPSSIVLIAGPIDGRINPTKVNDFATKHGIKWFKQNMISFVPSNYEGYRRRVYPGFLQLMGFMSMNIHNHIHSHMDLYKNLLIEDDFHASKQKIFYDDYLSVMDLDAQFYLQTVEKVFLDFDLAKGNFKFRDMKIEPSSITKTKLLVIEAERDDISGIGQTKAAMELCSKLPDSLKRYHIESGVGHYGSFSGKKFRSSIAKIISEFI